MGTTVKTVFNKNSENVLLEFTATCDIGNLAIRSAYEDKIIFDYPLQKFYGDKYSKDILTLRSNFSLMNKALQAVILSQYRLKIFQANRLSIKPVVLFKSAKIADSQKFMADFLDAIKKLDEGWDVLNLFDIVRLYEMRQSGGKKFLLPLFQRRSLSGAARVIAFLKSTMNSRNFKENLIQTQQTNYEFAKRFIITAKMIQDISTN